MKAREAIQIAWRELGLSEEQIKDAVQYADSQDMQDAADSFKDIKPGEERNFIESIKDLMLALDPDELLEECDRIEQRRKGKDP